MLKDREIVLGVTGGIAAYKAAELLRLLVKEDSNVRVIMTKNSQEFIAPLTFRTLSGFPVFTEMFKLTEESKITHISLADRAEVLVVAPATANIIGKIAGGIADDLLSTVVLATNAPVLICPAMNVNMYDNAVIKGNIEKLTALGYHFLKPGLGELACGYEGKGRLAEVEDIVEEVKTILSRKDLGGERVLITAGPTEEIIDPIRFITNRSSGKMGYALARVALRRGAEVTLISGPTRIPSPRGARLVKVTSAQEMKKEVLANFDGASIVVKAAAVADFRPKKITKNKIKKSKADLFLNLEKTTDILKELGKRKKNRILVGFSAETENLVENTLKKLKGKNLDLVVANDVSASGAGFDVDTNIVKIIDKQGKIEDLPLLGKERVAEKIWDRVSELMKSREKQQKPH